MKRTRENETYANKLRSARIKPQSSAVVGDSSSTSSSSDTKALKKAKLTKSSVIETGSSTSAFKTPKTRTSSKGKEKTSSSSSNSKTGLPPINLDAAMQEKWPERPALPAVDFRKDLLQPVQIKSNPVPRYKRVPVENPDQCADVADNIYEMCYQQEHRYATNWDYMVCQPNLTWQMRSILVDWLVDVHFMMKLQANTLWLTVSLLDRALARITVARTKLQLVGVAALSLACKMEEITLPYPDDFTYITEDAYSNEDLLDMELQILHAIHYEVHVPTGYHFLSRYLDLLHASDVTRQLAFYYAERNLQETTSLALLPSAFAAVCVYAALVQRDLHCEVMCSDLPSPDTNAELEALLEMLREHRDTLAKEEEEEREAAIKKEIKSEEGMDTVETAKGNGIYLEMGDGAEREMVFFDIPPWLQEDFPVEIDDLEEMEKKAKELKEKAIKEMDESVVKKEGEDVKEEESEIRSNIKQEKDVKEEDQDEEVGCLGCHPTPVSYDEVMMQHYEARRQRYARAVPQGAPTSYTAPCPRVARPVGTTLWGLSLTARLHVPLTREHYPVHPSYLASETHGDCYRAQCAVMQGTTTGSSSSSHSASSACSSGGSCSGTTDKLIDSHNDPPPPLDSTFSRISRTLAQLPPQTPSEAPKDVTDAAIAAGVAKLLQELPASIDMDMLQFYAKLVVEHVGRETVSPSKRHLNAARRKHSLVSEGVPNLPLPFFTAQDPMVYMMLLGPTLHSTGTTFYTTHSGTAGLRLLCPNHFPIPSIEPSTEDGGRDMKCVSSSSSGGSSSGVESSDSVGSIVAVSLNATSDGTIHSVAVRRSARHAGGLRQL